MQDTKNQDLRIQRTHALLLDALTTLLRDRSFEEVRVKDLCETARIHRSTFYTHFEDKFHLLTFGFQELFDILVVPSTALPDRDTFQRFLRRTFRYFEKNRQMYRLLFLDPRNAVARQIFQDEFCRSLTAVFGDENGPSLDLTYSCQFLAGGLLSSISLWLGEEAPHPPAEMAQRLCGIFPLFPLFQLEEQEAPGDVPPSAPAANA